MDLVVLKKMDLVVRKQIPSVIGVSDQWYCLVVLFLYTDSGTENSDYIWTLFSGTKNMF